MRINKNNRFTLLSAALACFLLALLLSMNQMQSGREALAARLAPSMLRFHILANSDSSRDQTVKLEVRSLLLDYISSHLSAGSDKEATRSYLSDHRAELEAAADRYLEEKGFDYQTTLQLTNCYFPTRVYDDLVIPCGYYDAARIVLGKGDGHNWWCVLYPRFCFVDAACKEIPKESRSALLSQLQQDDALALEDHRPVIEIRFLLFPSLKAIPVTPPSPDRQSPSRRSPSPARDLS
ncbi:MAG: stage II sporulation protein R [Lachnospiraceae bacterium]|nr:stage II sporulation protein R [Lachnospiraceae bacterium]